MPFFFFNDTATTEIYTLSLHDALPICQGVGPAFEFLSCLRGSEPPVSYPAQTPKFLRDRKSTRLNSSHLVISYAVFCLKKKNRFGAAVAHREPLTGDPADKRLAAGGAV